MPQKKKLILHVGLPKAASSALQVWADTNRQFLRENGVHYPVGASGAAMPKHQDLVDALFIGDFSALDGYLSTPSNLTLFLSTEGLTNHLYDYSPENIAEFRRKVAGWEVVALLMVRSQEKWITSYWKQALLNPTNERFGYGSSLGRAAFADLPRVKRLCNTAQVASDVQSAYGAHRVIVADQGDDWFQTVKETLRLPENTPSPDRIHVSISSDLAEIVRQMNAMSLPATVRNSFLALVQHSFETRHNILLGHAAAHPPAALAACSEKLQAVLTLLAPLTAQQDEFVTRLKQQLGAFCGDQQI